LIEFPKDIKFKYDWRKYQQRVLDDLKNQLNDSHLHIIAPPGSGKTVLGLEVAIRINKPTLILAPTLAIRNQWVQRFCELFLQVNSIPDWISRDIRNPKFLTIATYQGLHSACTNFISEEEIEIEEEFEDEDIEQFNNKNFENILHLFKTQNIKTIVLDEAHHLKNEWWQTLTLIKQNLKPVIVGLTATPPYDVSPNEYQRYLGLNGPIDTEISVPELVIEGDLCPHQDYVYFSLPTENENQKIIEFRKNIQLLFDEIKNDKTLLNAIERLYIWTNPNENLEWIYSNLSFYSASLIFLNANGVEIPKIHLEIIGDKKIIIPQFDFEWTETLLDFYLYQGNGLFKEFEEHRTNLENRLTRYGAIERRQISLHQNKKLTKYLTSSISKLNSIKEIVDFEFSCLKNDLRLVVLADFIRKEFFNNRAETNLEINKIGVIPIFEKLRSENPSQIKIGVLTGSIIILPKSAYISLKKISENLGIKEIDSLVIKMDEEYFLIDQSPNIDNEIVSIITRIFQEGEIEVLIGTKSLLGEGWDAPAINSLILASFVGSFVLSNQMRGRAIRTQNGNKNKSGNIWHLVCVDPTSKNGGEDYDLLKRRFNSFVGVSFKEPPTIENGIYRLNLTNNLNVIEEIKNKNKETLVFAADRNSLKKLWMTALENGLILVEEIKIPFKEKGDYNSIKKLYYNRTIAYLFSMLGSGLFSFVFQALKSLLRSARNIKSLEDLYFYLAVLGGTGFVLFGGLTYKTFKLYLKYRDISKDIHNIGEVVLNSLVKANNIKTDAKDLKVKSSIDHYGAVYCHLDGGSTLEKSIFINALKEVITPIENPRYIIVRKSNLIKIIKQKDYHSVPEVLGRNKILAEYFYDRWLRIVGSCELIFSRSIEGRKILLKSRLNSLASQFENKVEQISKWR
jgi:superfamily II DNA or RNA helicase